MNKFVKARLIGARALQISCGAPSMIDEKVRDSVELSYIEFQRSKIPLEVRE
ncbi:MAG: DNA-directed RNA polymerase subunit omega [Candidatus Micrarchaeota archaeon]|nr:DNA-directed RNA polymerase subunit omega [Candidatus Micrarchaeota archaeon]MCX8154652.1 DNA-directed RNA polymerase subunit omega [Candidatus Micrarchaeota archaeon]